MSKLDHAASLISSDAASKQKATLQQRTTNRKSKNTGYNVLFLRRKVAKCLKNVGGARRNRTADNGFADHCLTTWRPRHRIKGSEGRRPRSLRPQFLLCVA